MKPALEWGRVRGGDQAKWVISLISARGSMFWTKEATTKGWNIWDKIRVIWQLLYVSPYWVTSLHSLKWSSCIHWVYKTELSLCDSQQGELWEPGQVANDRYVNSSQQKTLPAGTATPDVQIMTNYSNLLCCGIAGWNWLDTELKANVHLFSLTHMAARIKVLQSWNHV